MIPMAAQDILQEEPPEVDKREGREEERRREEPRREETFLLVSAVKPPQIQYGQFIYLRNSAVCIINDLFMHIIHKSL